MDSPRALLDFELQAAHPAAASPSTYLYRPPDDDAFDDGPGAHSQTLLSTQQAVFLTSLPVPVPAQLPLSLPAQYLAMRPPTTSDTSKGQLAASNTAQAISNLRSLVQACNNFDGWNLPPGHAYLCLPPEKGPLEIFGILQPKVLQTIEWRDHGFKVTDLFGAKLDGVEIPVRISRGTFVIPKKGLTPVDITQSFLKITRNKAYYKDLPALSSWDGKEYVPLVMGHTAVKVSDKLGAYLGILQLGVHLTVYTTKAGTGMVENICVQRRSETSSYPLKLDQTAAGGLLYSETVRQGLGREAKEEFSEDLKRRAGNADYDGHVAFSMVRTADAGSLAGTLEISVKACHSLRASGLEDIRTPEEQNHEVKEFLWMTVEEVLDALKKNLFKPNCALVMIKFLIDKDVIDKEEEEVQGLYNSLKPDVFLDVPGDVKEYGPSEA